MTERIQHPDLAKFCTIREDYVAITTGNRCAALLLAIFEGYGNWRTDRGLSPWVDLTGDELSKAMCGLFCRKAIAKAGKLLEQLGLVRRKQISSYDRTYHYLLLVPEVQKRIELALLWDMTLKIALKCCLQGGGWIAASVRCLKALWGAIVPFGTMQESFKNDALNQETECKEPEGTTYIDTSNNFSGTPTKTSSEVEKTEEIRRARAASPILQESQKPQSIAKPETLDEDDFSAADDELKKSAQNLNSKKSIEIPQEEELKRNRIDFGRCELISTLERYPDRLHNAVTAWLQWAKTTLVKDPTGSLIAAIKENWQPQLSPREAWWHAAALAWGRERRDRLLNGVVDGWVYFRNGQQLALDKASDMSWNELAALGGGV